VPPCAWTAACFEPPPDANALRRITKQDTECFARAIDYSSSMHEMAESVTNDVPELPVRFDTAAERWRAVRRRDARADGIFYFAVKTTGVYCRPHCASRRPRRENVVFHDSCAAAERAGFRPCKRCDPRGKLLADLHADAIAKACRLIRELDPVPPLGELARAVGLSRYHFHRIFTRLVGLTPSRYARAERGQRLRQELVRGRTVTDAYLRAGFNSSARFYGTADRDLGMKPKDFRAGGRGVPIRVALGECSLGSILVAESEKGICAISLGDNPDALLRELQQRFPDAQWVTGDQQFEQRVARVVGWVDDPRVGLRLPLDIRGTAFQRRVWDALRAIPAGSVLSYRELARQLGRPTAIRAVARACAANVLAVAIPCHRVVRTDGGLSGYRWGVERKRALLNRENVVRHPAATLRSQRVKP
jgi:AraC family transcriptional regulator of adaptative response/methylated-DNA-[protein]-cysteine methyltransferase